MLEQTEISGESLNYGNPVDSDTLGSNGRTAFYIAVENGDLNLAATLVCHDTDLAMGAWGRRGLGHCRRSWS